jgi:hypothetical protein
MHLTPLGAARDLLGLRWEQALTRLLPHDGAE